MSDTEESAMNDTGRVHKQGTQHSFYIGSARKSGNASKVCVPTRIHRVKSCPPKTMAAELPPPAPREDAARPQRWGTRRGSSPTRPHLDLGLPTL